MALPKMRSIKDAVEEIRAADPDTAITECFLRRLIKTNTIPSVQAGMKYLVNMDVLERYLQNPTPLRQEHQTGIRRVAE